MKGIQNKKGLDLQKPVQVSSCMVDLFDLNTVTGTKLNTDKSHKDEYTVQRNIPIEENQKEGEKLMKTLLEEEMYRETETNQNPPSVVARLMGLNEFPEAQIQNSKKPKTKNSNSYDKKMELVHQKFAEAKQLATNEKLFHSREFQDALQFLSSNRDLFVKFLEEPNALFSNNPPVSPEIKHITVLKPCEKIKKLKNDNIARSKPLVPTRIVVLKPNLDKTQNPNNNININGNSKLSYEESENLLYGDEIMSDFDVYTPTSGNSYDFNNDLNSKNESPVSLSSHESRVVREAKKRLVERWEMVSNSNSNSNLNREINEENEGVIISTCTLGDVLTISLSDKKEERENEERESMTLFRSKSLPVDFRNAEVAAPKVEKSKSSKGLFKWKLSSLFFPKNNNNNNNNNNEGLLNESEERENSLVGTDPCTSSGHDISIKAICSEQEPSPVSVLETSSLSEYSDNLSLSSDKALFRSPLIGSISRSLSWDNSQFEIMSPNSLRLSKLFSKADEEENSFNFIQKLVNFSNLERENTWFSLQTPLDPSLFYEFLGYKTEGKMGKEKLLFDSVNEAILEIENCAKLRFYPWSGVSNLDNEEFKFEFGDNLCDKIWGVVRNWCTTFERLSPNYEVDLVAKKEVSGTKVQEIKSFAMFDFNSEICGFILDDLVEEFILEFNNL